jgi:transposase-like protein
MQCGCKYTPVPKARGYDAQTRQHAVQLYVDGMNLRRIGRHLGVHHKTVSQWVKAHSEELPDAPLPEKVEKAELDELYAFIENKKTESI